VGFLDFVDFFFYLGEFLEFVFVVLERRLFGFELLE
jgi:hypothetical protein